MIQKKSEECYWVGAVPHKNFDEAMKYALMISLPVPHGETIMKGSQIIAWMMENKDLLVEILSCKP